MTRRHWIALACIGGGLVLIVAIGSLLGNFDDDRARRDANRQATQEAKPTATRRPTRIRATATRRPTRVRATATPTLMDEINANIQRQLRADGLLQYCPDIRIGYRRSIADGYRPSQAFDGMTILTAATLDIEESYAGLLVEECVR